MFMFIGVVYQHANETSQFNIVLRRRRLLLLDYVTRKAERQLQRPRHVIA